MHLVTLALSSQDNIELSKGVGREDGGSSLKAGREGESQRVPGCSGGV